MYANCAVCGGGSCGPVDDLMVGAGNTNGNGQFFAGGGIGQHNVTYRKNMALWCGCSVPVAQ